MPSDQMADEIAAKQRKAWDSLYSPVDLERDRNFKKRFEERKKFKSLMLECLKNDEEFRNQVKEILK